ncbi:type II toxin-antitoxin system PemK/MazF family toxin [Azospirillum thiophilum]|uniref:type II toxin-antitoxin system PemK/MazF family toxin n=1 Tax=Azospirillum thiophilum TaxID=528244 RepID=UPI000A4B9E89|nr:type II toxin-antitoxin system PemK/MazF family toxin [Azospirillum thiophilum]
MTFIDEADAKERAIVIKAAPAIRNLYWCDLWTDAVKPEFWKRRPVIVISYKNMLHTPCLVVPLTTKPQAGNRWAHKLTVNYVDANIEAWAVCNHLLTVSPARLSSVKGKVPRLTEAEFHPILAKVLDWLPKLPPVLDGSH